MLRHLIVAVTLVALCAVLVPATPAFAAPPPNDDFADAQPISGQQGEVDAEFSEATREPGDPAATEDFPTIWYRWTAPTNGWYEFSLAGVDSFDRCLGTSPVFQGTSLDSLARRSHPAQMDDMFSTTGWYVRAVQGRSYVIAAATSCPGYPLTLTWQRRGPLIVTVLRPEGTGVEDVRLEEPYFSGLRSLTNAAGQAYFRIARYDATWRLELSPGTDNLAERTVFVKVPPATRSAVTATRSLRATPVVDLDRDGLGDVVSGVPLADRGRVNAGAVVVRFGDGRRRVVDEASAGVPTDRASGEQFGAAVSTADVDRDGWADLTVGAPGEMVGTLRSGAIFIVFGSAKGLGSGRPSVRYHQNSAGIAGGAAPGDRFGAAVAVGLHRRYTHFAVGVPGKDSGGQANSGALVRFTRFPEPGGSRPGSRVWHQGTPGVGGSNVAGDRFGSALAHGGFAARPPNQNETPYLSLAIGVPGKDVGGARDAGAIVVLRAIDFVPSYAASGNPLITQNTAAVVPGDGAAAGNGFGSALLAFREQGALPRGTEPRARLAVGAPGEGGGTVTVLSAGQQQPLVFAPTANNTRLVQGVDGVPGADEAGDRFGAALAAADVNDDGERDLVLGAPGEEVADRAASGSVTLLYGARSSDMPARWIVGGSGTVRPGVSGVPGRATAGARFGTSAAALDVDGNGYPDVVGGAPGIDASASNGGAVYAGHHYGGGLRGGRVMLWPEARPNDGFGAQLAVPQLFSS